MSELMAAFLKYLPLRGLVAFSGGGLTDESLDSMLERLNQANPGEHLCQPELSGGGSLSSS